MNNATSPSKFLLMGLVCIVALAVGGYLWYRSASSPEKYLPVTDNGNNPITVNNSNNNTGPETGYENKSNLCDTFVTKEELRSVFGVNFTTSSLVSTQTVGQTTISNCLYGSPGPGIQGFALTISATGDGTINGPSAGDQWQALAGVPNAYIAPGAFGGLGMALLATPGRTYSINGYQKSGISEAQLKALFLILSKR